MNAFEEFSRAEQGNDVRVSCLDLKHLRDMKLDLKHTIIFSQDKNLDIISASNTSYNKNFHNSFPADVYIKHETGFITCDNIHHGNIKVGSKTFYNTFLETSFKTPTVLGQNTTSHFLEFINIGCS